MAAIGRSDATVSEPLLDEVHYDGSVCATASSKLTVQNDGSVLVIRTYQCVDESVARKSKKLVRISTRNDALADVRRVCPR